MNLNELAVKITKLEGGKVNLPISQVKEVMKLLLTEMATWSTGELEDVLTHYYLQEGEE